VNLTFDNGKAFFDILLQSEDEGSKIESCTLPMPGDHNVSNALAAVAVARHLGMKRDQIREALAGFAGVNRRFTKVGEVLGGVTIIDAAGALLVADDVGNVVWRVTGSADRPQ